jgi:acyl carrier protein
VNPQTPPTSVRLEAMLTPFVRDLARRHEVEADFGPETPLFELGYLNSLRILDLIAFLEKTLQRRIPDRDVRLASFRSIRAIATTFGSNGAAPTSEESPDRIFTHRSRTPRADSPTGALQERGWLTELDAGRVAVSGSLLGLLEYFDGVAREWARELGATEHEYPALIALDTLQRAGYSDSFPQHLAVVSRVAEASPLYALAPAVCFHCYAQWQGRELGAEQMLVTARGRCCRLEREALAPLERLRDFTMREIVVLGNHRSVESLRRALVRRAEELVEALDLDAVIEAANDPFYGPDARSKRLAQRVGALKYELRVALDGTGRATAVASFNHHGEHFGRAFDIRLPDGRFTESGCVALGLERWALAFLARYGLDERDWPDHLVAAAGERR